MLDDALRYLVCPVCGASLHHLPDAAGSLVCESGHSFDIARQGYVSLLAGSAHTDTADTAQMVDARDRFLSAGHFRPVSDAVVETVLSSILASGVEDRLVVEVGAGTGHYLARVLEALPDAVGVALDVSKHALRRAARLDRVAAIAADVWRPLPLADGCADVLLDVFAPRNPSEFARILAPHGVLVTVTPAPEHLSELRAIFNLMEVEADKLEALRERLAPEFRLESTRAVRASMTLTPHEVALVVGMGPNAFHLAPEAVSALVEQLPPSSDVTLAVDVSVFSACPPC